MSRRPTPTSLKVLRGNPGKRPLNEHEPQPGVEVPEPPEHLGEEARREWERITADLADLGLIAKADRPALAAYCQAWERWVEAEQNLRRHGVVVRSPSGYPVQSPFLAIANRCMDQMRKLLVEFGLTPASRTRVHARPKTGERDGDPGSWADIMGLRP